MGREKQKEKMHENLRPIKLDKNCKETKKKETISKKADWGMGMAGLD